MTTAIPSTVVALVVVALLGLILRWTFKPSRPRTGPIPDAADSPDLGLLDVVAEGRSRTDALMLRATLGDAGIRSSMSKRRNGDLDVLVFHQDADRARALLR
ncbi:MAG: hypothetical protein ABJB98_08405 [Actinomycetota bacterium]